MYSLTRSAGEKYYSNVSNIDLAKDGFHLMIRNRALIGWNCESEFTRFEKLKKVAFWDSNKIFCISLSVTGLHGLAPSTSKPNQYFVHLDGLMGGIVRDICRGLVSYNGSIVAVFGASNIRNEVLAYSYNRKQFTIMTRKQRFDWDSKDKMIHGRYSFLDVLGRNSRSGKWWQKIFKFSVGR